MKQVKLHAYSMLHGSVGALGTDVTASCISYGIAFCVDSAFDCSRGRLDSIME